MRAGFLAVLVAATAVAAVLGFSLAMPPSWVRSLLVFLGAWTIVSVGATAFIVSWFRATARANEALTQGQRQADWKGELTTHG